MVSIDDYKEIKDCVYKDEHYSVRDNGAVMRHSREGKRVRRDDDVWTFGKPNDKTGYMEIAGQRVHRIVAYAFHGNPPTDQHVVDHIDTNRRNNRPENLRWLTRLENILLNDITRSKIEYICGSVEAFLKNPSLLRNHELEDSHFSWMHAVSQEESENTLKWWEQIKENPRPKAGTSGLGEWIYTDPDKDTKGPSQLQWHNDVVATDEAEFPKVEITRGSGQMDEKINVKELKKIIIAELANISKGHGWKVKKNDNGSCKADIFISCNERKIAINIKNRIIKASETLNEYKENGVDAYWLIIDNGNSYCQDFNTSQPFFRIIKESGTISVQINESDVCTLNQFIEAAINNKIVIENSCIIKDIKVLFEKIKCYKCHTEYTIYTIPKIKFRNQYLVNQLGYEDSTISEFDPKVIKSVHKFLLSHPEIKFSTDIIKERYSNTLEKGYVSFGCPKCDAICGAHYLDKIKLDSYYENDENLYEVHLEDAIKLEYLHWIIQN